MEAKDRILPDWKLIDIAETLYNFRMAMDIEGIKNTLWQLAKQQDNVSFPKGEKQGIKKVVEWLEQEAKRHHGKPLGTAFEVVLHHYYQHKDITLDKG